MSALMLFSIVLRVMTHSNAFEYSDLVSMNASCKPKDTCFQSKGSRINFPLDWKERNCFCDALCGYYGDCCVDAHVYEPLKQQLEHLPQKCMYLRNYGGVYMKQTCSNWTGPSNVEEMCYAASPESSDSRPDPILGLPVTSRHSKLTYANYYCALCNNDSADLQMWQPRVECPTLTDAAVWSNASLTSYLDELVYVDNAWELSVNVSGKIERHLCTIDPFIPDTIVQDVRLCKESINTCPEEFVDDEVKRLCSVYTAVVYHGDTAYRNFHCAMCYNHTDDSLSCYSNQYTRFNFKDDFNSASFAVLLDFSNGDSGNAVAFKCSATEIWDPFFRRCRSVFCAKISQTYRNGRCVSPAATAAPGNATNSVVIVDFDNKTTNTDSDKDSVDRVTYQITNNVTYNGTHKSQNIIVFPDEIITTTPMYVVNVTTEISSLNCNRILLPHGEFEHRPNDDILISKFHKVLKPTQYELHEDGVLVCLFEAGAGKFSNVMGWVTIVGLGVSFICLAFHLFAFATVSELRNLSGKNLASLAVSLLCAYVSFILGVFGEEGKPECIVLACFIYYFFLSSFCWMNVLAFDVWRTLRLATTELRVTAGKQWYKFATYCCYAWSVPAVAVAIMLAIDLSEPISFSKSYLPQLGQRLCWFGQRKALLVFFAAPLVGIMTINLFFFVMAAKMIATTSRSTAVISAGQPHHRHLKLFMRLALLMGLSWISGIMAGYLQTEYLWYIFIVLNSLQGAFIFLAFTCKKKILKSICCFRSLSRTFMRPMSSARHNLHAQDSTTSQDSHTSSHSGPNGGTSSTSIAL